MRIYNLFPLLAGRLPHWTPHLERAAGLGFDWVFVNPIQPPGESGSLYSIADYFAINPALLAPHAAQSPEDQVRAMAAQAERLGLRLMVDLVVNHCAHDAPLVREHPEWFVRDGDSVAHPYCVEADGRKVVWGDLAQFDHHHSPDAEGLWRYCVAIVDYLIGLGFRGFRCDAAYQIPAPFWRRLIGEIKGRHPESLFVAETLGCSPEQTRETAAAGFDAIFNSAKWWDFQSPWLLEQYEATRRIAPSIGFPESHDTERLFTESDHNPQAMKQRYLFTALFSSGVMMPLGFEYGFRGRLHVVETRPEHWEEPAVDLTDFIRQVNQIKVDHAIFRQEGETRLLDHDNPAVLLLRKASERDGSRALIVLNKDPWHPQHFHAEDLSQHVQAPLIEVSPDLPPAQREPVPAPYSIDLGPGIARVFVTAPGG
ncbi:alpha-amylase family glycosyl hydrolase [Thiococcus pfennigii]|uniref:alpha-amylase family glycosyl hydrolase n=1 Tax=Thiococcus pfennigii TaxID=1057 RepID=UPI001904AD7D|nr:alpha-amylase family glycosyl hydrolase [Thiococcus pfennigii]MBK1730666.1 alpha-amylase [Thiococcus pfennigii]